MSRLLEDGNHAMQRLAAARQQMATLTAQLVTTTARLDELERAKLSAGELLRHRVSAARYAFMFAGLLVGVGLVANASAPVRHNAGRNVRSAAEARHDLGVPVTVVCKALDGRAA